MTSPKRIILATDTYYPQVNGVSKSLQETREVLEGLGHEVALIGPDKTMPNPIYPQIPMPIPSPKKVVTLFEEFKPDHIHIATEGPIGILTRSHCVDRNLKFTTSFHTLWPEYLSKLMLVPSSLTWNSLWWFHSAAELTMTRSKSMMEILRQKGFQKVAEWTGSYDPNCFYQRERKDNTSKRPIYLYIGRVSVEKNLEAFLNLDLGDGTKRIVGDGPYLQTLKAKYPEVEFLGEKSGEELAQAYCEGDVFVFPSLTDTFGRVVVEALASGVPVAAFPVTGPKDILASPQLGAMHDDLRVAIEEALRHGDRYECARYATKFSKEKVAEQFLKNLVPVKEAGKDTTAREQHPTN
ncbi:MAG: glycosyltransferase family 1 protein [Bdellovibrionales bacterium]|nr:glycosyltransferase family 1 protein [Bdellovibrionales bacterium]